MSKLLLDTSVIIDFLRRKDKDQTLLYRISDQDLYISIITHTELYAGKSIWEINLAKQTLEKVLQGITILPLEKDVSLKAGRLKAYNHNISLLDCIIASTAPSSKLELVTLNVKDFESIKGLKLFELK